MLFQVTRLDTRDKRWRRSHGCQHKRAARAAHASRAPRTAQYISHLHTAQTTVQSISPSATTQIDFFTSFPTSSLIRQKQTNHYKYNICLLADICREPLVCLATTRETIDDKSLPRAGIEHRQSQRCSRAGLDVRIFEKCFQLITLCLFNCLRVVSDAWPCICQGHVANQICSPW